MKLSSLAFLSILLVLAGCSKEEEPSEKIEETLLSDYIGELQEMRQNGGGGHLWVSRIRLRNP